MNSPHWSKGKDFQKPREAGGEEVLISVAFEDSSHVFMYDLNNSNAVRTLRKKVKSKSLLKKKITNFNSLTCIGVSF